MATKSLSSHLIETPKQYIEVHYKIFITALFGKIIVDMYDTSQLGSRNFFSYDSMTNLLQ